MKRAISILLGVCLAFSLCLAFVGCDDASQPDEGGDTEAEGVDFVGELFGEDLAETNFYNYCPSIMMEGEDTMHVWYCSNRTSGNITDYIAYRKGTKNSEGKWVFSEKQIVLEPTLLTWDTMHTCDPTVVKGTFNYRDTDYTYLMAYLGCESQDNMDNQVGLAVANAPEGPWIKCDDINPICNYIDGDRFNGGSNSWGYGQAGMISADKAGKVILTYSKADSAGGGCYIEYWDFADLDDPQMLSAQYVTLRNDGSLRPNGTQSSINNPDIAYDPNTNRLYVVSHNTYESGAGQDPTIIPSVSQVLYVQLEEEQEYIGELLFSGEAYSWTPVGYISEELTGFPRNHNSGIVTDEYGWLTDSGTLRVVTTVSCLASEGGDRPTPWPYLHSYRLHGVEFDIS